MPKKTCQKSRDKKVVPKKIGQKCAKKDMPKFIGKQKCQTSIVPTPPLRHSWAEHPKIKNALPDNSGIFHI